MFPMQYKFYVRLLAMASTQWTCILLLTGLGHCYVNLSRKQGTKVSQSSTRHHILLADYANDGNRTQTNYTICSHTALGHSIAWFQVDLGGEYNLKYVTIYYRNEDIWPPYRFRQFYVDVSNITANSSTTLTSQRKRCYTDNTTAPATPPAVIDIPCKETARYVIVETTYDAPENNQQEMTGPVLEICEIEVYALTANRSESPEVPATIIVAGLGGFVFVLIAVVVTVFLFRFRRQKHSQSSTRSMSYKTGSKTSTATNKLYTNIAIVSISIEEPEEEPQSEILEEAVHYKNLSVAKDIAVKDLLNDIRQKEADESIGFMKEYKSIPYGERFPCNTAKLEENQLKNRFRTTFPYDHSRVVLDSGDGFDSDYINANYIESMDGKREYIACQGPRENTLIDHWRMIWQKDVQYIVMLTNLIEGPKVKCHQYWPSEGHGLDVNPFSVTLLEEKVYACYIIRKMAVRKKRVTGSRTIVQFHYTRWPDHGTPNPLNLVIFHRHFRHKIEPSQHPMLVHCSAGIGRTGTFIALDVLSRYGDVHHRVNVVEFVKAMRKDRMTMIQNADQYVFLYHALYEYFRRKGTFVNKSEFMSTYADLDKPEAKKKITNEFNALKSLQPQYDGDDFKTGQKYLELNLTKSALPVEQYLVYLSSNVKGRAPYYNAVFVSSFAQAEEFISAQYPVSGASIDLISLLVDQKSSFLISLNPFSDVKEIENWVDGENSVIDLAHYEITRSTQTMLCEELRTTNIEIKRKDSGETHTVKIFECLSWSSSEILPNEHVTLTNLIKHLSLDRKSHPEGPITVISKDGATCCGVFLAVYNAVDQILQDDEVDIFTIVQQLQCHRPEMISRKEEYEFCFRSVWNYLSSDNMYDNT
ncbi:receptor-type tyrosine-protein phosphatase mu-like [Ostrea edulis]|uniref:receptor-type tyrosine-protein phosphatase mu-like n=1 Tax=Ostrea edulis TaxID=37623 RepID=UPI0024AEA7CE|nr:receptor-type tyrosine-protein phosphatase mu-like [Ostrea edulis]